MEDLDNSLQAVHLAVSENNVMYLKEKFSKHVLNPCPPCMCCVEAQWREDFEAKVKKMIPLEKITDIEVHESGANELITPGCMCPPACNPISIEVPVSKTLINTAGGIGPELIIEGIEDANSFRRFVMDLKKRGGGGIAAPIAAPMQQGMGMSPATIGANSEMLSLLQDIRNSNIEIRDILRQAHG